MFEVTGVFGEDERLRRSTRPLLISALAGQGAAIKKWSGMLNPGSSTVGATNERVCVLTVMCRAEGTYGKGTWVFP